MAHFLSFQFESIPYTRFPNPVIYVHMSSSIATMGWVSLSDKHLVAFILHQHTLTPTTWEFISMYRRIWLSYHKYANHDAYQRHRRYEEIPSTWNRSRICHNFISFRQIFSHKRYFSACCGISIVVITISYCDTVIHKYTSVALENDAQEWQCKYILHLTLLITFWQLWILYIERHLHKYGTYHHLQLRPDTHDRQNILSHTIQILGWSGCRISSSNVFYVILLSLSVLVLWPVGETCHLLLFFCFCVMS